ncbi:MAG: DUF6883 domain-containing protein [Phototrophicaceae bacterium]|jgi:hypothetical protein
MKLPNVDHALVQKSKITEYLLAENNPSGKAGFFTRFGFSVAQWEVMQAALLHHAKQHEVMNVMVNEHGTKYVIEGEIISPDGRNPAIRAIWIVDIGYDFPRLVSAYPL